MVENLRVKPESPVGHSDLTLVDILVALTRLTLENGSNMIVPEATVNYVAAISGVTPSELAANIAPGTNSAEAPPVPAVVPDAVLPAPTVSAPVAPPIQMPPVQMPAPGTYGGPGYPPVEFPGAYLEIPPGVSPTDTTVRWYTITVGLRVGVFPHWGNVSPYVSGIKGGACFTRYSTKTEADAAFFLAVRGGKVRVIGRTPCTTLPPYLFNGGGSGPPPPSTDGPGGLVI